MPDRIDIVEAEVFRLIVERLRTVLILTEERCYETTEPLNAPQMPTGGDYFLSVSPGDSIFDEELAIGGQTNEIGTATVTYYSRIKLDRTMHDKEILRNVTRGLLPIKKKVLKTLQLHDLLDDSSKPFLRQFLMAVRSHRSKYDVDECLGWGGLDFKVSFDWDLS